MKRTWMCLVMAILCLGSGCAAGYRAGYTSHSFSDDPGGSKLLVHDRPTTVSTAYHELRLIDTTGILLAGLVNTSRHYIARQEALEQAKNRRDTDGDGRIEVDYSFKPFGIYPGSKFTVDLRLGAGDIGVENSALGKFMADDLSYWGIDAVGEWYSYQVPGVSGLNGTLIFAAHIDSFDYNIEQGSRFEFNALPVDVTFGSSLGYTLFEGLVLSATADIGLVSPLTKLIIPSEETSYLNGTINLEATYYLFDWLGVNAYANAGRLLEQTRSDVYWKGGLGLIAEWGLSGPQ